MDFNALADQKVLLFFEIRDLLVGQPIAFQPPGSRRADRLEQMIARVFCPDLIVAVGWGLQLAQQTDDAYIVLDTLE